MAQRIAYVTGGMGGIGTSICQRLSKGGFKVIAGCGPNSPRKDRWIGEQKALGYEFIASEGNVSDWESTKTAFEKVRAEVGRVDVLVNNAGITRDSVFRKMTPEDWKAVIDTNLNSLFNVTKQVIDGMIDNGWGRIINIASVHALVASTQKAAYVAAKHGIIGLTKVTALENARTGITCNAICPGWVLTPLVQKQVDARAEREGISNDAAKMALVSEKQPSGEFVTPEQLGALAVFLCGPDASEVRGVAWNMDGGWIAQ